MQVARDRIVHCWTMTQILKISPCFVQSEKWSNELYDDLAKYRQNQRLDP